MHPARGHPTGTLAQLLGRTRGAAASPSGAGIVHRLDRDTSGLLVVARSEEAHRRLRRRSRGASSSASTSRSSGAARRRARGRSRRRSAATRAAHAAWLARPRRARATRSRTSSSSAALARHALLRVRLETGACTRSASTCGDRPAGVGDPVYGMPARSGSSASSCTPPAWRSPTRSAASGSRSLAAAGRPRARRSARRPTQAPRRSAILRVRSRILDPAGRIAALAGGALTRRLRSATPPATRKPKRE